MVTKEMQEDFDNICKRAKIKQGSFQPGGRKCAYRGENGLKCFVGEILPDNLYNPLMESLAIGSSAPAVLDARDYFIKRGWMFFQLDRLQAIHDCCLIATWKEELTQFALGNELKIPK